VFSTKAWAQASGLFTTRNVVQAERELLKVLRFDLHVSCTAVASHYAAIMARYSRPAAVSCAAYASHAPVSHHVLPMASSSRHPTYAYHAIPFSRRPSVSSVVSSGSSSPLDSPELQTPPETYIPRGAPSHVTADPKRSHVPASHVAPYVLASDFGSVVHHNPANVPAYEDPQTYLLGDGKHFGDANTYSQPSLLAELYQDLDPQFMQLPPTEIAPPMFINFLPDTAHRHISEFPPQFEQNPVPWADAPLTVHNFHYAF
jgi:hypothetical protein